MARADLSLLSAFLVVADERNFTRAAKRLNVSTSGLSHAIRRLEEQVGVRLLARTTRSVAPTDAGEQLIAGLRPALGDIRDTLATIAGMQERPAGRLRLLVPRVATHAVGRKIGAFARTYPDVILEVTSDDRRVDLVAAGYDAGIQFGEYIAQDMVTVRLTSDIRPLIVAAPDYLAAHGKPATPHDLLRHRCINFPHGDEGLYRWELDRGDESVTVSVTGSLIVEDAALVCHAAVAGAGLAYVADDLAQPFLDAGQLEWVLRDWSTPFPGFFLYYPSRRQQPAALRALIEILRL